MIAEYDGANALQRRYVHGPGVDEPLVWYEGAGTADRRYLISDQLGSIVAANGNATSINAYDEFGQRGAANSGRFQYTGQMWLNEAGVYHYKARAYHPGLGRFNQTDPILYGGGMNVYAYVGNDPVNFTDPFGLQSFPAPGGLEPTPNGEIPVGCREDKTGYTCPVCPRNSVCDSAGIRRFLESLRRFNAPSGVERPWEAFIRRSNEIPVFDQPILCAAPQIEAGGALDAYAGVGGTVGADVGFNPANGQLSLGIDLGVGLGAGTAVRATAGGDVSVSGANANTAPIADLGLNVNGTLAGPGLGLTGSRQLVGSNPGATSVGLTHSFGTPVANVNISGHGQVNLPPLYNLNCQ